MTRPSAFVLAALALFGARSQPLPANEGAVAVAAVPQRASRDCLAGLWRARPPSRVERAFDRAHDPRGTSALSCQEGATASALQRTIDRLKRAAQANDAAAMGRLIHYPLIFVDRHDRRSWIRSPHALRALFGRVFTADVRDAIGRMDLSNTNAVGSHGICASLGGLWMEVGQAGTDPLVATVNQSALRIARHRGLTGCD